MTNVIFSIFTRIRGGGVGWMDNVLAGQTMGYFHYFYNFHYFHSYEGG